MHDLGRNEDRLRGTYEFPFEFHHIDSTHPRYVMSYHWHVECEIMRILQGTLTVTLDEKSFTAKAGDVIFVNSGVLHSGKFYTAHVKDGDEVKKGQTLITFDMDAIKAAGYDVTTPLIVTNTDDYEEVKMLAEGTVNNSSEVLEVK